MKGHVLDPRQWAQLFSLERGRVSLRTLILIRWVALAGQLATLLVVRMVLGFTLPLEVALGVVGASAIINLMNAMQKCGQVRLDDRDAMLHLAYDIVQVAALLCLTGGLQNPFTLLILAPVTVGASVLSRQSTAMLAAITIGGITLLAFLHEPLPWHHDLPKLPGLYILAIWFALTLATIFIAAYTWSVTEEGRRINDAYAATQLALAREQQISAVGALAAAAAHELGSPLATIAVVAKELARDLPPGSPYAEDAQLLLSETARCRTILAELSRKGRSDEPDPFSALPIAVLVELAGNPHHRPDVEVIYETEGGGTLQPAIARRPEILHGLGNIIQNALQFASQRVEVMTTWDQASVTVEVADDGPGFPAQVLSRLGQPYLSGRSDESGHMGLGIFIAETLLQRTGAMLEFANSTSGGAVVRVTWMRSALNRPGEIARPARTIEEVTA
jgi:two-component system sensor histidine kinase RegB